MAYIIEKKLPDEKELKKKIFFDNEISKVKRIKDEEIKNILSGKDSRILAIVGPCSIDNEDTAYEYANKLAKIQEKIKEKVFIIMRANTVKPRSITTNYKGILHFPTLLMEENICLGIETARRIHANIFSKTFLPTADELVYPELYKYFDDVTNYFVVGARSVENQEHKLISSLIDIPIGMKNPLNGNIQSVINSIISARSSCNCIYNGNIVKTSGNFLSHLILRGYVDKDGNHCSNYDIDSLLNVIEEINESNLNVPIIVDCSHSNSKKDYTKQKLVLEDVLESMKKNTIIKRKIKGFMIESYLYEGSQDINEHMKIGKSITDSCIGIEETEEILLKLANSI